MFQVVHLSPSKVLVFLAFFDTAKLGFPDSGNLVTETHAPWESVSSLVHQFLASLEEFGLQNYCCLYSTALTWMAQASLVLEAKQGLT